MRLRRNRVVSLVLAVFAMPCVTAACAQGAPPLGDSARALIGSWEFSNADRDKRCNVEFKSDRAANGYKVEFDKACVALFAIVPQVSGWVFPENDFLRLVDASGRVLAEFSEVEDGIYEAPTPGVGVLFIQKADAAGPAPKPAEAVAGDWGIVRTDGNVICVLMLGKAARGDAMVLTVRPGCDPAIARLGFAQWQIDRSELLLQGARGAAGWRFEELDSQTWRRIPDSADPVMLVRQ